MSGIKLEAYSRLASVLSSRRIAIPELRRQMQRLGVAVNIKSLYRLTSPEPLLKIDLRIVGAICRTCRVGIEEVIDFNPPPSALQRLDAATQKRLDELMSRNTEGTLTALQRQELEALAEKAHQLTMANARLLAAQRRNPGSVMKATRRASSRRRSRGNTGHSKLRRAA